MEDISSMINNLLSSPDGMAKVQAMASAVLGQSGSQAAPSTAAQSQQPAQPQAVPQLDPSAIASILSGLTGSQSGGPASGGGQPQAAPQIDPAMIASVLAGLGGAGNSGGGNSGGGSSGGGNGGASPSGGLPDMPINPQMLGTIANAMMTMNKSDKNVELLYSLKKHLGEERSKRVDDAARIMQLIKMLPLLKESGLFGDLIK